jgi:hypothetical protein
MIPVRSKVDMPLDRSIMATTSHIVPFDSIPNIIPSVLMDDRTLITDGPNKTLVG